MTEGIIVGVLSLIGTLAGTCLLYTSCYGWLDGEDSDNVLPATTFEEDADTVHIHDLAVFITNQEAAAVSVQVGVGSFVTTAQMTAYAAPVLHTQAATTKMCIRDRLDGDSDDALDEDADFTFEDFDILTPFTKF